MKIIKIWMISLLVMVGMTSVVNAKINTYFSSVTYDKTFVPKGSALKVTLQLVDSNLNPIIDAHPHLEFEKSNGDIAALYISSTEHNDNIYI